MLGEELEKQAFRPCLYVLMWKFASKISGLMANCIFHFVAINTMNAGYASDGVKVFTFHFVAINTASLS